MEHERQHFKPPRAPLGQRLGMLVIEAAPQLTVVRMPVEGNTQIAGILHGGATAALCETAGSIAAYLHAQSLVVRDEGGRGTVGPDLVAVGTDLSVAHLRSVRGGEVVATAVAEHLGRRTTVHRITVNDDRGRTIATCIARNMIVEAAA